ncbi:MAG: lysophospholipid acyltransferase family protein [candidate division Zixibacteria bacterium]|nr:lysophospholipid acyltransferase family protein [candidate division Zixibacteria bacterium]MCI0595825.1 lysophospholipid acyltransferase family protein [candidate division Zixibacteria bacterium]
MRQLTHFFEYLFLAALGLLLAYLPAGPAAWLGRKLGGLYYRLSPFRRRVAEINLLLAGLSPALARSTFENVGLTMTEFARFRRLDKKFFETRFDGKDPDYLREALKTGRGAVLITGHFGNWELLGAFIRQSGFPLDVVVKEQRNPFADRWIDKNRMRQGVGIIKTGVAIRAVVRSISEERLVAFVSDQYVGEDGILVNFMGRPTTVSKGPAAFAVRLGVPIVVGFLVRTAPWNFKLAVFPALWPNVSADRDEEILRLTQAYTSYLEELVRQHPEHYLWMHRKWKNLVDYKTGVLKSVPPVEEGKKILS